jgi:heavy metal sensor kinase
LAASIDANDLDARLNLDLPDDELGRLSRTFDAMLARIEESFERQRRFTGDAAHELRTPLSLLRSEVDLALARPRTADEYRETLREMDADLARLTGLVGTLLSLSRSDTGQLTLEPSPVDLGETMRLIADQYAETAAARGIELATDIEPATANVDEDLIVQVLVNLVDNAIAHTPIGGRITLGAHRSGNRISLSVADTGIGIAPEHQARVFDRFYRVDPGRSRARGGVGLGLSISKAIVEAHDGRIALTSQPGSGTTVQVLLPGSTD